MTPKILCDVYRSPKKDGLYLYVEKKTGLDKIPGELLDIFGKPELALTLMLHAERKLARVDIQSVLRSLEEQGFYLQMPPVAEAYMTEINQHNAKLVGGR